MDQTASLEGRWHTVDSVSSSQTFEEFFAAERDSLLRAFCVITGSRTEAEDIVQEAFVKVFERWERVGAMDNPAGYLEATSMNVFRNRYRRAGLALRRTIGRAPDQDVFQVVEDRDVALRALASLTPKQRAAIVLTEALGYSGQEAGQLMGIKASTVWALTHQGRNALQKLREVADV